MSFKRQADTELNQDNVHEMDKEVSDKAKHDTWKKAPDDVLATRKILKVSDGFSKPTEPAATSGGFAAYAKINPFAAMGPPMGFSSSNKTTAPSIVTSATGNGAAKLVPEATSSPKTNPFGAPSPAHNPFMNFVGENKPNVDYWQKFKEPIKVAASESVSSSDVKVTFVNPSSTSNKQSESTSSSSVSTNSCGSSTSGGGDEKKDVSNASTSDSESANKDDEGKDEEKDEDKGAVDDSSSSVISEKKTAIDTAAMFCKPTELDNGEAGEECVLKLRAKLYRLTDVEKSSTKEWVEMGTGPVRLLTPSTALDSASSQASEAPLFPRVVMRREHQAGGPGTKVILNALFRSHFSVAKMGERAARLTCLAVPPEVPKSLSPDEITISPETKDTEEVKPVAIPMTFLFKMQHSHEADQFIKHINTFLEKSNAEDKKD